jgi:PAS domain S-box-containing protein
MDDQSKIKQVLIQDLASLRQRISELERSESERKQVEEKLRESEEKYRNILENIEDGYFEVDLAGNFTFFNPSLCRILGYPREEMPGMNNRIFMDAENAKKVFRAFNEVYVTGFPKKGFEWETFRKDGARTYIEVSVSLIAMPGEKPTGFRGIARDVTERKRAGEALRKSEENYRQLFDNSPTGIYKINFRTGKFLKANAVICEYLGCSQEEITSLSPYDVITKESQKLLLERLNKMAIGDKLPEDPEYEIVDKNGKRRWLKLNSKNYYDSEGLAGADVVAHDITDRKRMEEELRESEELFRSYLENAPDGTYMNDLEGNFLYGNRKCEEIIGYRREELIGKNFLELNLLSENSLNKAVRLLQANMEGKSTGPDEIELISKGGLIIPVEINTNVVQRMGQRIILSTVRDITERKKAEESLKETLESLRKAFGVTIQVLVSAVETRDPYTAGHQIRSADLARTIATEMGLSLEKIEGIRIAGTIHDIGKLSIPAEILSKPTKLSDIEFSLIKEHARQGYEILKNVESPWPLAEIVYQHHERMDGSGYPRNLKGEEILIEARILTVADVVEAMASHRPYRPGLGLDAALEKIEKNRGTLYDEAVVDTCLRLFREKGFQLEKT